MKNIILILLIFASGCTTIHFDNGEPETSTLVTEQWHHNMYLSLYERSSPVVLEQKCHSGEWNSVKTELSFVNGLASNVVNSIIGPIWYPKTVQVSCR